MEVFRLSPGCHFNEAEDLAEGLRQGEAQGGLRREDTHLEAGTLSVKVTLQKIDEVNALVQPKTERNCRTVKLPDLCLDVVKHKVDAFF